TFEKDVILIGRDVFECDVSFDKNAYPMISRRHAELRWHSGTWYLVDLNSSYGTFLNGQRVSAPMPVAPQGRIQIGESGPLINIISTGSTEMDRPPAPAVSVTPAVTPVSESIQPSAVKTAVFDVARGDRAKLEFVSEPARRSFELKSAVIWLGRDPSCEIIF